jgi:DNA-binding NtrC family response regulator
MSGAANMSAEQIRLLLVDDEEGYVNVLANRLGRRGMNVVKTYSGAQALRALRSQDFDVVVLDLKMEDMDGIEVLHILKQLDKTMEVIMLSGHGSQASAREGLEQGAFDYLTKPCELDELIKKIREAYEHRKKIIKQ